MSCTYNYGTINLSRPIDVSDEERITRVFDTFDTGRITFHQNAILFNDLIGWLFESLFEELVTVLSDLGYDILEGSEIEVYGDDDGMWAYDHISQEFKYFDSHEREIFRATTEELEAELERRKGVI